MYIKIHTTRRAKPFGKTSSVVHHLYQISKTIVVTVSHINKTTKSQRVFNFLSIFFSHTISHRVMTLKEFRNGLAQVFLSLNSKDTLSCRLTSIPLSRRTAKNNQATKKNEEEFLLTNH